MCKSKTTSLMPFLLIVLFSCTGTELKQQHVTTTPAVIIEIQPFNDIAPADIKHVFSELKKVYPDIVLNTTIKIPSSCYYKPRNRYRADSIIRYLSAHTKDGHVTIGLTNADISTTKNEIRDFGLMGSGFRPGNACVASTFRLSKENKLNQLFKVAIHELGHTQGLPHCPEKTCFMRDAEGRNPTNQETDFCSSCKATLTRKGWQF